MTNETKEKELLEQINGSFKTAESCIMYLVESKVEEALILNKYVDFPKNDSNQKMNLAAATFQEIRYRFINNQIEESGCKNILDIGCGYSPRAIYFADKGYKYVGIDMPNVINTMNNAKEKCIAGEFLNNVTYLAADITNENSIEESLDYFSEGPVCIVSEGILMYINEFELEKTLLGIHKLLERKGGVFVTADYAYHEIMKTCFENVAGSIYGNLMLMGANAVLSKYVFSTDDKFINAKEQFAKGIDENAVLFYNDKGFEVENLPILLDGLTINIFDRLDDKAKTNIYNELMDVNGWKVSISEDNSKKSITESTSHKGENFSFTAELDGDELTYTLSGRVDTITAVPFLEDYQNYAAKQKISSVKIDMKDLDYMSSAGLRVLLVMKKSTKAKNVSVYNANSDIISIFETTGFDGIISIL